MVDRIAEVAAVGAVLEHDRHLDALALGLARAADADADAVAGAVVIGVERRLDEDDLLDRVGEGELRLCRAVLDLEPRWRLLLRGSGRRGHGDERSDGRERCTT